MRFLTGRELLMGHGLPVTNIALQAMQPHDAKLTSLCSYNVSRVAKGQAPRHRVEMTSQCGNSIFVPMVGSVLHFVLMFVELLSDDECNDMLPQARPSCFDLVGCIDSLSVWRRKRFATSTVQSLERSICVATPMPMDVANVPPLSDFCSASADACDNSSVASRHSSSGTSSGCTSDEFAAALRRARARRQ